MNCIPQLYHFSIDETSNFSEMLPRYIDLNSLHVKDLDDLIQIILNYRTKMNRVVSLPTGNSSRSNLYYVFKIELEDNKSTYLTIIDSASDDNPNDIFKLFLNSYDDIKLENIIVSNKEKSLELISKYTKNHYKNEYSSEFILKCLKESIYNNESQNHFEHFINLYLDATKKIKYHNFDKYLFNRSNYFINPTGEYNQIFTHNNCLQIPILLFLQKISQKTNKKLKYYLMYNIRKELSLFNKSLYTLQLFQNINDKKCWGDLKRKINVNENVLGDGDDDNGDLNVKEDSVEQKTHKTYTIFTKEST